MNRREYLYELEKALKTARVSDMADILSEYEEHFTLKQADGYGEEEIAAKLASPKEIANQFAGLKDGASRRGGKAIVVTGLVFADIFVAAFFILLFAWVAVIGAFSIASAALGICLVGSLNVYSLIPYIPYFGALISGISCLALGVLSAAGTVYSWLYAVQLMKAYTHWHKAMAGSGHLSPPPPKHPMLPAKQRRAMRTISLISLAVFGICFIAGMIVMMLLSGSLGFWHTWGWFVS